MERKVIVIAGPTCSGKTALSFLIAEYLNIEIISADSRQVYKYLNIGTAKPSKKELKKIKHYFIDILKPDETYNIRRFENDALKLIQNIFNNDKNPLVVGGSGLYIKALVDGITDAGTNEDYRKYLIEKKEIYGNEYLHNELKKVDPESAAKMLPQNWKRVIRALEVFYLTNEPIWKHQKKHSRNIDLKFEQFGLLWDRANLYKNIDQRVDDMIGLGLVDEVKIILRKSYDKNINALNTVGYKEIISYLDGEISLDRAIELIKRNTRRFAKRQMTWFNADKRIKWLKVNEKDDLNLIADQIIRSIKIS